MSGNILTPPILLKKLSSLPGGSGLTPYESLRWFHRFETADKRRKRFEKETGLPALHAVIFSPTMRCNYTCTGCYSRNHPTDQELSADRIDTFFTELEEIGASTCLISGGEPFLHKELPRLMQKHPNLLFVVFTNGSQITQTLAQQLKTSGNIIPVLSVEGDDETVSRRRGAEACTHIRHAIQFFQTLELFFGFSTMVTKQTLPQILAEDFFGRKAQQGYRIGFVLEYVPVGKDIDRSQILTSDERQQLRQAILKAQQDQPLLLFQLPDDGDDGINCGAARRFMHINSTGGLEPCPFAHHSDVSLRDLSLRQALHSPFFERIRKNPQLFKKTEFSCALAENDTQLQAVLSAKADS